MTDRGCSNSTVVSLRRSKPQYQNRTHSWQDANPDDGNRCNRQHADDAVAAGVCRSCEKRHSIDVASDYLARHTGSARLDAYRT